MYCKHAVTISGSQNVDTTSLYLGIQALV